MFYFNGYCLRSTSKFPKEDDESCNESDREDSSIAEGTPIVRPRNSKKGPFDFDGTRCYQELNNEHTVGFLIHLNRFCFNIFVLNKKKNLSPFLSSY